MTLRDTEQRRYAKAVIRCQELLRDMVAEFHARSQRNANFEISMALPPGFLHAFDAVRLATSHPTLTDTGIEDVGNVQHGLGMVDQVAEENEDSDEPLAKRRSFAHGQMSESSKLRALEEVSSPFSGPITLTFSLT